MSDIIEMIKDLPPELQREIISKMGKEKYALYSRKRECAVEAVQKDLINTLEDIREVYNGIIDAMIKEAKKTNLYFAKIENNGSHVSVGHKLFLNSDNRRPYKVWIETKKCGIESIANETFIYNRVISLSERVLENKKIIEE